ncbi:MAG: dinitrogenase iron-molybdenum cofactor biosynthesis protein [Desulfuromonadaceae bacterium]|nr:dinitrogenase iron-molybdenum cofactor biosynthesis protein [Desulfuromonadaceae bacterium]
MKIAFTTSGENLDAPVDSRFGRAARFLLFDLDKKTFVLIDNAQNLNAAQGAGIQAAENVVRAGADVLVTGHCGPKAFRVLQTAGVTIYNCEAATIAEALKQFKEGKLQAAASADVEGHW